MRWGIEISILVYWAKWSKFINNSKNINIQHKTLVLLTTRHKQTHIEFLQEIVECKFFPSTFESTMSMVVGSTKADHPCFVLDSKNHLLKCVPWKIFDFPSSRNYLSISAKRIGWKSNIANTNFTNPRSSQEKTFTKEKRLYTCEGLMITMKLSLVADLQAIAKALLFSDSVTGLLFDI